MVILRTDWSGHLPRFSRRTRRVATIFTALIVLSVPPVDAAEPHWPAVASLLRDRCVSCHAGVFAPMALSLVSHGELLAGSYNGAVVVPGDVPGSPLVRRIRGEALPRMPLDGPPFLSADEIALIEGWIAAGAPLDGTVDPEPVAPEDDGVVTFADVEPILKQRCIVCHSDNSRMAAPPEGLRLTDLAAVLSGGERLVVVPGNPEASELYRRVAGIAQPRMPFDGPPWLPDDQIALIRQWIAEGAVDDAGNAAPVPAGREVRLRGRVSGATEIDGAGFVVTEQTRVEDRLSVGMEAEVRATIAADGSLIATRLRAR